MTQISVSPVAISEDVSDGVQSMDLDPDKLEYLRSEFTAAANELEKLDSHPNFYGAAYSTIRKVRIAKVVLANLKLSKSTSCHEGALDDGTGVVIMKRDVAAWLGWTLHLYHNNKTFTKTAFEVWMGIVGGAEVAHDLSDEDLALKGLLSETFADELIPADNKTPLSDHCQLALDKTKSALSKMVTKAQELYGKATLSNIPDVKKPF